MRYALLCVLVLAGCGSHPSSTPQAPPPGPYADIAGRYYATVVSGDGIYASIAPGTPSILTIADTGYESASSGMSLTGWASYRLYRQADGSLKTNGRYLSSGLGTSVSEIGTHPSSLSSFTLNATEYWSDGFSHSGPVGTLTYALVKMGGG